jgi:cytochrome b pre-mRNA-processing protein 3
MLSWLFGGIGSPNTVERLHAEIVAQARDPAFFTTYAVEDSFEGRFELLTLHAWLVLRRLASLPPPAPEIAQDLTDILFRHFDIALRELGVGDTSVPKRMRRLAEAFLGRCNAYDEALRQGDSALSAALSRNVYAGTADSGRLARYVELADSTLGSAAIRSFTRGEAPFPDPSLTLPETLSTGPTSPEPRDILL